LSEGVYALPLAHPSSGISSDRAGAVIPLLELLAARVSRAYFASSRAIILAANDTGVRLDGKYGTAYNGR
jgi:hypothetical protein